jgi:hypothetical protein
MALTKVFGTTLAVALVSGFGAHAALLDFSGVQGNNIGSVFVPGVGGPGATINHSSGTGTILVGPGAASQDDGFCFISTANFSCEADGEMVFASPVMNLTFDIDGAQTGDSVEISAFNGAAFLGALTFTVNGLADFSGFGTLTRLFFDDSSSAAGVGYSTFSYDAASTEVIPVPAALPLLAAGIAAFGIAGWRRRRA